MPLPTRERILDAAIELFARDGYQGTSIVRIERAVGLTPGSGAIYHHFPSKQALLRAGLVRQLERRAALRDIQLIMRDLGDLRAELTMLARYALLELDEETELLRLVLTEARHHPDPLDEVVDQLIAAGHTGFASWLHERQGLDPRHAATVASLGLGALFAHRLPQLVLGRRALAVDDDDFVAAWVRMLEREITDQTS
jgi:AcrR family transcriptional regulator